MQQMQILFLVWSSSKEAMILLTKKTTVHKNSKGVLYTTHCLTVPPEILAMNNKSNLPFAVIAFFLYAHIFIILICRSDTLTD
jgi:hypothetical protein